MRDSKRVFNLICPHLTDLCFVLFDCLFLNVEENLTANMNQESVAWMVGNYSLLQLGFQQEKGVSTTTTKKKWC